MTAFYNPQDENRSTVNGFNNEPGTEPLMDNGLSAIQPGKPLILKHMRTKNLEVSMDSIIGFTELLGDNELEGTIMAMGNDSGIKISVSYDLEDRGSISYLMELIDSSDEDQLKHSIGSE